MVYRYCWEERKLPYLSDKQRPLHEVLLRVDIHHCVCLARVTHAYLLTFLLPALPRLQQSTATVFMRCVIFLFAQEAMDGAAKGGHLETVIWLHANTKVGATKAAMVRDVRGPIRNNVLSNYSALVGRRTIRAAYSVKRRVDLLFTASALSQGRASRCVMVYQLVSYKFLAPRLIVKKNILRIMLYEYKSPRKKLHTLDRVY